MIFLFSLALSSDRCFIANLSKTIYTNETQQKIHTSFNRAYNKVSVKGEIIIVVKEESSSFAHDVRWLWI